ncbi:flagellum-associated coiled-coil domain-containing protein 1 [Tiliqua scincoides]|uniref:flagellum-associated coiled-coil domain-containing protein 1 n=1 Tax=Tiliqua scincoides TaxID=71010 RepID=UPI003461B6E3
MEKAMRVMWELSVPPEKSNVPVSTVISAHQKQTPFSPKPTTTSITEMAPKSFVQSLRTRERLKIIPDVEMISSGFTLSRTADQIEATLEDKLFEKKKPIKPIVPSSPPKLETEDVIADLVEQISELTAIMEQLRRDHHTTHKQLEQEMAERCTELQEEHEKRIKDMKIHHATEMENLEEQYKKELRSERATAQEKMAGLQKEYKYLKNAFRVYQDSISDEMEEKWLRRQAEWKKSERTEREKALLQQRQSLTKRFESELEEQKKIIQNDSFLVDKIIQNEREEHQKQHAEDLEKIAELEKKIEELQEVMKEKNETLDAIASTLHKTEMELRNEKLNITEMEKAIQQRIAAVEEKHRINVTALIDENVTLRRKLIEKNEEIYNERARKSGIGGSNVWNQM